MTEKRYIFTAESKDVNDALNRLNMIVYMITDNEELLSQTIEDLTTLQRFVNKYAYLEEIMEE